jgi:hypothetical protein
VPDDRSGADPPAPALRQWLGAPMVIALAGAGAAVLLLSATELAVEAVGRLAPDGARGVATGLHGSAIMGGAALAQPLTGLLIDRVSPTAALLVAIGLCLLVAVGARVAGQGVRSSSSAR